MTRFIGFFLLGVFAFPGSRLAETPPAAGGRDAPGGTPVRLQHRFQPGQELVYEFANSLKQDMTVTGGEEVRHEMTLTGVTHQVVADVDPATGEALIGWLGRSRWNITAGAHGLTDTARDQTWIAAYRMDRAGRSIGRELAREDARCHLLRRSLDQISEASQLCAAFPSNSVTGGQTWSGPILIPTPGTRQSGWAVSSLADIRRENGTNLCVIGSRISSGGDQSHITWRRDLSRPDMDVSGTSEGIFDADLGIWRETRLDLTAKMEGQGFSGVMKLQSTVRLVSQGMLPGDAAAEQRRRIKVLDEALSKLYQNDVAQATALLEEYKSRERDADWKKGIEVTLALIDQAMNPEPPIAAPRADGPKKEAGPEARLMQEADAAANDGRWEEAVEKYRQVAEKYPDHDLALQALSSAAPIAEQKLGQKDKAEALRKELATRRQKRAGAQKTNDSALTVYKQAGEYAQAGESQKAAELYEKFLAAGAAGAPAATRLLAQYRLAGLFEKLGQKDKAAAAYRAVQSMAGDDDYARNLKQKATEKAAAIAPPPNP